MATSGGDWKALYAAAEKGDVAEVRAWLAAGTDPDFQHVEIGTTPLIAAAERGHREVVEALVAAGAGVGVRSQWDGWTAAEAARDGGHGAIARWLDARAGRDG